MSQGLFQSLRHEIGRDYGITKKSIPFIPFEDWRSKLQTYPKEFDVEYQKNLLFLKREMGLNNLKEVENSHKKIILFVGIPGAGKTTLAQMIEKSVPNTILLRGHDIVDALNLFGKSKIDVYKKRLNDAGFRNPDPWYLSYLYQDTLTRDCLQLGYNVVFDDHMRTRVNRLGYMRLAKQSGAEIYFIQINAPLSTFLKREEGKNNMKKVKFLANFIFQSQDMNGAEKKQYDKVIQIDGTSSLKEIKRTLIPKLIS